MSRLDILLLPQHKSSKLIGKLSKLIKLLVSHSKICNVFGKLSNVVSELILQYNFFISRQTLGLMCTGREVKNAGDLDLLTFSICQ